MISCSQGNQKGAEEFLREAEVLKKAGSFEEAVKRYQQVREKYPDTQQSDIAREKIAECRTELDACTRFKHTKNIEQLEEFVLIYPASWITKEAFLQLGLLYEEQEAFEKALKCFQRSAELGNTIAILNAVILQKDEKNFREGLILFKEKRYSEAKPFFLRVRKVHFKESREKIKEIEEISFAKIERTYQEKAKREGLNEQKIEGLSKQKHDLVIEQFSDPKLKNLSASGNVLKDSREQAYFFELKYQHPNKLKFTTYNGNNKIIRQELILNDEIIVIDKGKEILRKVINPYLNFADTIAQSLLFCFNPKSQSWAENGFEIVNEEKGVYQLKLEHIDDSENLAIQASVIYDYLRGLIQKVVIGDEGSEKYLRTLCTDPVRYEAVWIPKRISIKNVGNGGEEKEIELALRLITTNIDIPDAEFSGGL